MSNGAEDLDKCFEVVLAVVEKAGNVRNNILFLFFLNLKNLFIGN